jgi:hypothetical protein
VGTPRHRDPTRFGTFREGAWVPYEVIEGRLIFACGHSQKVIIGSVPGTAEEKCKAFLAKVADRPCAGCLCAFTRLRFKATEPGEDKVS